MPAASVSLCRFDGDLRLANRATGTIQQYVASIRRFEEFAGMELSEVSQGMIRRWVDRLQLQPISHSRLGRHYAALKCLYGRTLGQPEKVAWITITKDKASMPIILSQAEIPRLLDGLTNAKYRMFFTLIYATGMRIRESSRLQTQDIDAIQQVIHVRNGKGGKDRLVPMSGKLYGLLRAYYKHERPPAPWLFTSRAGNPVSLETARRALLCAAHWMTCRIDPVGHPRPKFDIADIVREHRPTLEAQVHLNPQQRRMLTNIGPCRTAALGGHVEVCEHGDFKRICYNSCRDRPCPKCQALAQEHWIAARSERLLNLGYLHGVFTLSSELRPLAMRHPAEVYGALFRAVTDTLLQLGRTRLKATLGLTLILRTWTRELMFHVHLHVLVTAGGLAMDGSGFVRTRDDYLFPLEVMGSVYRAKMLHELGLRQARHLPGTDRRSLRGAHGPPAAPGLFKTVNRVARHRADQPGRSCSANPIS